MKTFNYINKNFPLPKIEAIEDANGRRYRLPSGNLVPSITTVLSHFKKKQIQEWRNRVGEEEANRISSKASIRGTKFHSLMERYLENKPKDKILNESVMPNMRQAFFDALPVVNRIDNIHYIECGLFSEKIKLAGRTDVIAEFDGELSIIDFKTSAREKKEEYIQDYFVQATAYSVMYEELTTIPVKQIVIIMSTDGLPEPQLFVKESKNYVDILCQKIYDYHVAMKHRNT
jgi:genome maintenance exonuclease 1